MALLTTEVMTNLGAEFGCLQVGVLRTGLTSLGEEGHGGRTPKVEVCELKQEG